MIKKSVGLFLLISLVLIFLIGSSGITFVHHICYKENKDYLHFLVPDEQHCCSHKDQCCEGDHGQCKQNDCHSLHCTTYSGENDYIGGAGCCVNKLFFAKIPVLPTLAQTIIIEHVPVLEYLFDALLDFISSHKVIVNARFNYFPKIPEFQSVLCIFKL